MCLFYGPHSHFTQGKGRGKLKPFFLESTPNKYADIHLLIADAKNRLQFAEKWGLIMIKKPHAEKTVTRIQHSVPERTPVIKERQCDGEHSENIS